MAISSQKPDEFPVSAPAPESSGTGTILSGGGQMGGLMRKFDWSKTAIGPIAEWPQSLKTAVRIILTSRYAMFVWWGRELVNLYNDPYRAFLGIKHPEALGKSARDVWAEIWSQIGPRTDAVLLRGESTYDEALLLMMERHGYVEETYFTFSYSPLPDDKGNIGGLFCAVTEDTQRVIGERRLTLLHEVAASMAEARAPVQACAAAARCLAHARRDLPFSLFYLMEPDGRSLRRVSLDGIEESHHAAPEVINLSDDGALWPLKEVVESGSPLVIEDLRRRVADLPAGAWSEPPDRAVLVPFAQQGQARPAGVLVAGLNPYRKFDDGFRSFVTLLAHQVASGLANARAYEKERQRAEALAELDRAKTLFFSNVSHEFRTPLTLLLGPLDDVLSSAGKHLRPEDQQQLVVARRNALRLLKLVNTLLEFSRIEAGRVQAVYEAADIGKITAEIGSIFYSAMEDAGLHFSVECQPVSEPVYVDCEMWERIVLNLLSNAFKFTFEGEVALSLKKVDTRVELSVRDTGVGIPSEELPRVFERFHRVESSRARTHEGTGIGLALVQELVKLHGGTVSVQSAAGKGSTFTVSIPLGKAHLPSERIQAKRTVASTALSGEMYVEEAQRWLPRNLGASVEPSVAHRLAAPDLPSASDAGQREGIVVADDNADMRDYLTGLLRDRYEVHTAADGAGALEAARRFRPALVLADVMMPGVDGFELLNAIRNDPEIKDIPLILLSARAGEESQVEGLELGADDYLVKPFTARELRARVATHVRMAKLRRETADREARLRDQALLERHRLAAIVESSDDAIVSKDLNGIVTSWNAGAEKMFGYRADEIIGRSITTIIPPELYDDEKRILETLVRGESIEHFETVRMKKSGERLDVSLTVSPVRDSTGKIIGAAKIARDITQRNKAEQALRTTERLASVGRLAATVAHEINNPLEAVTNLIYLAKTTSTNSEVRGYLATAEEELDRVSQLTKQTLGFYRDTKGATSTRIGPLVTPLLSVFASRTRNKSVEIQPEIRQDPEIMAVRGEIRQLLANLLSNSIDAVGTGGRIRLRVSAVGPRNGYQQPGVRITVADSGSGIPRDVRAKLFEPFFTTKKEVGTGLGLWVCKTIVEKHGGTIRVRSSVAPGKSWTAFSVFLPSPSHASSVEQEFGQAV